VDNAAAAGVELLVLSDSLGATERVGPDRVPRINWGRLRLADVKRDLIRTRIAEGRTRAKARGQRMGRPPKLTPEQQREARRRRAEGATLKNWPRATTWRGRRFQGWGSDPRRVDAVAISVEQQRRHHRRIKRRLPPLARVSRFDLAQIEMLEHQRQNKASQVVRADKVLHARRQQQRLINLPGAERLAHKQAESDSRPRRHRNPQFLGQAPSEANGLAPRKSWSTKSSPYRETNAARSSAGLMKARSPSSTTCFRSSSASPLARQPPPLIGEQPLAAPHSPSGGGDDGELVPHEAEQEAILVEMVALWSQGRALRAIAAEMQAKGHQISHEGVAGILKARAFRPKHAFIGAPADRREGRGSVDEPLALIGASRERKERFPHPKVTESPLPT
jgi:hypothetical protein